MEFQCILGYRWLCEGCKYELAGWLGVQFAFFEMIAFYCTGLETAVFDSFEIETTLKVTWGLLLGWQARFAAAVKETSGWTTKSMSAAKHRWGMRLHWADSFRSISMSTTDCLKSIQGDNDVQDLLLYY